MQWLYLSIAIVSEVIATSALKSSNGFTLLWAIHCCGGRLPDRVLLPLRRITHYADGNCYAIWSGAGITLIALIGWLVHGQGLDIPAILGLVLIIASVIILSVFSCSRIH